MTTVSHQDIYRSMLDRIRRGEWALGALIPGEVHLAEEYGCARTTVNRAMRGLAEDGVVIRKRKGGTRVNASPRQMAKFEIPIVREQVETSGGTYGHILLQHRTTPPPAALCERLSLSETQNWLYLETLHLTDRRPFAFETRWVNPEAVPEIFDAPLDTLSVNEWLVRTVPFSNGDVSFHAVRADIEMAKALDVGEGEALFAVDRTTWLEGRCVTTVQLLHHVGFQMSSHF